MAKEDKNDDGQGAGDGAGGDHNKNAGDDDKKITLTSEHIAEIAQSVGTILGVEGLQQSLNGIQATLGADGELRKNLSQEITGAVKRQIGDMLPPDDKNKNKDKDKDKDKPIDESQFLAAQIKVGDETLTGEDLIKSRKDALAQTQAIEQERATRKQTDKVRTIKDGLAARGFIGSLDVLAKGYADNISIQEDGSLVAADVERINSLGTKVKENLALDAFLDLEAKNHPEMVGGKVKAGTGGNTGTPLAGEPKFSLEKCDAQPALYDQWLEEDPEGLKQAQAERNASAMGRQIAKPSKGMFG
jgi:hypothetical protein